jgi:hypothetical protein
VRTLVDAIDGIDGYSAKHEGLGDLYEGLLEGNAAQDLMRPGRRRFTMRARSR